MSICLSGMCGGDYVIRKSEVLNLKESSERIGRLYPILLDKRGNIIDGRHRLEADKEWSSIRLEHIVTDEQLLVARLVSNVCRRTVQSNEKTKMLEKLGELYLRQGYRQGEIACKIAETTGMSYRWVMKYMPAKYKARAGIGGPSRTFDICRASKSQLDLYRNGVEGAQKEKVSWLAAGDFDLLFSNSRDRVLEIKNYNNTDFVNLVLERKFFMKLERIAVGLGLETDLLVNNIFHMILKRLEGLSLPMAMHD